MNYTFHKSKKIQLDPVNFKMKYIKKPFFKNGALYVNLYLLILAHHHLSVAIYIFNCNDSHSFFLAKYAISGSLAMLPSSLVSSQSTASSPRLASFIKSTLPSVEPRLSKTPSS